MARRTTKSFVSRLGKRGKEFVERAAGDDRELPFEQFIDKRWCEAMTDSDRASPSFARLFEQLAERYPKLTSDRIDLMLRLRRFGRSVETAAVARRAVRNDPAELVLGLRISYRTAFAVRGQWQNGCDVDQLLPMCACGDIEFARRVAQRRRGACSAIPSPAELITIATVAWLNDDKETQAILVEEIESTSMKYVLPFEQAMLEAFCAAHHGDSDTVACRITDLLTGIKKLRDKADISHVINLRAHGLYRLLQCASPALVQAFDATQGFPWDPEVHAWCNANPAFTESWDFKALSKDVHEIVVLGRIPRWLPKLPDFYEVELLEADPGNEDLLEVVDSKLSFTEHDPKTIVTACPIVFVYEYDRENAERVCRNLNSVGGTARVNKAKSGPYRPIR